MESVKIQTAQVAAMLEKVTAVAAAQEAVQAPVRSPEAKVTTEQMTEQPTSDGGQRGGGRGNWRGGGRQRRNTPQNLQRANYAQQQQQQQYTPYQRNTSNSSLNTSNSRVTPQLNPINNRSGQGKNNSIHRRRAMVRHIRDMNGKANNNHTDHLRVMVRAALGGSSRERAGLVHTAVWSMDSKTFVRPQINSVTTANISGILVGFVAKPVTRVNDGEVGREYWRRATKNPHLPNIYQRQEI